MTSLARQLELLKTPQTSVHKEKRGTASFLYDFFEAKSIDADTHYSTALDGLEALCKIEPYAESFKKSLFHVTSKEFDRGVKSKEDNERIDNLIEDYLFNVVSKHFELSSTHKTIEWLIYRYQVNEYNVDALIGSILPYHETRSFVRLLMTCPACKDPHNHRWYWLKNIQEKGVPLPKSVFVSHCSGDTDFRNYVLDTVLKAVQINPKNNSFPSFFVSFCFVLIEDFPNENNFNSVLNTLSKASRMKNDQLYIAIYLVFSHLSAIKSIDQKIVTQFLKYFIKNITPKTFASVSMAVNIICKQQNVSRLEIELDASKIDFLISLSEYDSRHNFEALMVALFGSVLHSIDNVTDSDTLQHYKNIVSQLFTMINSITKTVIRSIIVHINQKPDDSISTWARDFYVFTLQFIEKIFADSFDQVLESLDSSEKISKMLNSARFAFVKETGVPLFVGLDHANPIIRRKSIVYVANNFDQLMNSTSWGNVTYLKHVLQTKLLAELETINPEALLNVFSIEERMFDLFSAKEFESIAFQVLAFCSKIINIEINSTMQVNGDRLDNFFKLSNLVLKIYCTNPVEAYLDQGETTVEKFFLDYGKSISLFSYLVPTSPRHLSFVHTLLHSKLADSFELCQQLKLKSEPAFKQLNQAKTDDARSGCHETIANLLFRGLIEYLANNYDHFASELERTNYLVRLSNHKVDRCSAQNLLWLVGLLLKSDQLSQSQRYSARTFCLSLLLCLLSVLKLTKLAVPIKTFEDLNSTNNVTNFLLECSAFSAKDSSLSYFVFVHVFRTLIDTIEPQDFASTSNSIVSFDWKASDEQKHDPRVYLTRIYSLLACLAPKPKQKPIVTFSKSLRFLFVFFLKKTLDSGNLFNFLSTHLCNNERVDIQLQTLAIIHALMVDNQCKEALWKSINDNSQFVLPYIIALQSSSVAVRESIKQNLKTLYVNITAPMNQKLVGLILKNSKALISGATKIEQVIGEADANVASEMFNEMLVLLQEDVSNGPKISIEYRNCLLSILSYSHFTIKRKVFELYRDRIVHQIGQKTMNEVDEQVISHLITFYSNVFNDENLFTVDTFFIEFYYILMDATRFLASPNVNIFKVLTRARFEGLIRAQPEKAVQLMLNVLQIEHRLSGTESVSSAADQEVFRAIQKFFQRNLFDSNFIVDVLENILSIKDVAEHLVSHAEPESKRAKSESNTSGGGKFTTRWKLLRMVLNQFHNNDELKNTSRLVKTLFDYLKLTFMKVDDNSIEVTRQLILYAIANCVELRLGGGHTGDADDKVEGNNKLAKMLNKRAKARRRKAAAAAATEQAMEVDGQEVEEPLAQLLDRIDVGDLINCIRDSRLKETQTVALFLINLVAPHFEKQILDSLVAIFAFIGSNLLQCDDQNSRAALFDTMESIIPIIIKNNNSSSVDNVPSKALASVGETDMCQHIVATFVKSFYDIPSYRRMEVFRLLVTLLGEHEYLSVLAFRILEQSSQMRTKISKTEREEIMLLLVELCHSFDVKVQLRSVTILLQLFGKLFIDRKKSGKRNFIGEIEAGNKEMKEMFVRISSKTVSKLGRDAEWAEWAYEVLRFIGTLMGGAEFVAATGEVNSQQLSGELFYALNVLLQLIVSLVGDGSAQRLSHRLNPKRVKTAFEDILTKLNVLLPTQKLIELVVHKLLPEATSEDSGLAPVTVVLVKRKALELLNAKLIAAKLSEIDQPTLLARSVVKQLLRLLPSTVGELNDAEIHNIQLIMLSLKLTCKFCNPQEKSNRKLLSKAISQVVRLVNSVPVDNAALAADAGDEMPGEGGKLARRAKLNQYLKGSSILCLTQMITTLDANGIQYLAGTLAIIYDNFKIVDDTVLISSVSALHKIVENFAKFLSPHLENILNLLVTYGHCDSVKNFRPKLQSINNNLATLVPKRVLFKAIDQCYEKATQISPEAVIELMNLFQLSCNDIDKADLKIIGQNFKTLMLNALSYRSKHHNKVSPALIEKVETSFGGAFSAFILKLDNETFRPIFYALIDWSVRIGDDKTADKKCECLRLPRERYYRMIAFYRFCSQLAVRLQSLFLDHVATSLVDNCVEMLVAYHSDNLKTDDDDEADFIGANRRDGQPILRLDEVEVGEPLVAAILATLSKCFLYDLNGTFVKNCTSILIKPIVNQVRVCSICFALIH